MNRRASAALDLLCGVFVFPFAVVFLVPVRAAFIAGRAFYDELARRYHVMFCGLGGVIIRQARTALGKR